MRQDLELQGRDDEEKIPRSNCQGRRKAGIGIGSRGTTQPVGEGCCDGEKEERKSHVPAHDGLAIVLLGHDRSELETAATVWRVVVDWWW